MRKPNSMKGLEDLGRVRLSENFFFRDFLFSEIAVSYGISNVPDDPDLAIEAGRRLCEELLEPLQATFGRLHLRSGYRSAAVNEFGNRRGLNCSTNAASAADHIWDMRDADGCMGATACIVVPWLIDHCHEEGDWRKMAWWIHDHLPYASLCFFPKLWAFNIQWHERPVRRITSYAQPRGVLTKPGMANHAGDHSLHYHGLPPPAAVDS
ncbi:hypothetical protein ABID21_000499 [Pseudorhizobium tarimense]|uniref:Peptidase M15 n=1 Tax=Pseudorhizobium tarimense TaxID=1079109 RepID=A0ABV2H1N6_9HYPH|nr:hypothetical protein [Pseudorhizobium tarimense]MCJ8517970.1 hypothetical protein [Pseudorhizobium tarimense]